MKLWRGWAVGLLALVGCDVDVGRCLLRDDAGICVFDDEYPWFEPNDAGAGDGAVDATALDGGAGDDAQVDAGGEVDAGGGIRVDEFCRQMLTVAVAWRDLFNGEACGCPRAPDPTAESSLALRTRFLSTVLAYTGEDPEGACIAARNASIDGKRVRYDGRKATACAEAFRSQFATEPVPGACPVDVAGAESRIAHGGQTLVQLPVCREAFVGLVPEGKACADQLDCLQGLRCIPAPGSSMTRTCQRARAVEGLAELCTRNSDCVDGAICSLSSGNDRRCIGSSELELKSVGGNCDFSFECATGLVCLEGRCATPTSTPVCGAAPSGA